MAMLSFQRNHSSLTSNHSNMLIWCSKKYLSMLKTFVLLSIFVLFQDSLVNRKYNSIHLK